MNSEPDKCLKLNSDLVTEKEDTHPINLTSNHIESSDNQGV